MNKKYSDLTQEEKRINKDKFIATIEGKNVNMRLNRVMIIGIVGIIVSVLLFVSTYFNHDSIWAYIYAATILLFSLFFIIAAPILKRKKLYNFYLKNKNLAKR